MKKIISCLILAFFLAVALTPSTYAQDKPDDVNLTLNKTVEMALKQSNSIKQIEYDIERGEESRKFIAERLPYLPGGPGDPGTSNAYTALIATDMGLQMTKKSKGLEVDRITLNVFNAYYGVITAQSNLELAKLQLDKAKKDWQVALLSYDTGVISKTQLKLAESGNKTTNTSYELAQKEVDRAYQNLNSIIGLKPQDRPVLNDNVEFTPIEIDNLDNTIVRIMDGNPALWLAEQQVKLENIELNLYDFTNPSREPYKAKQIDIQKAELSAADKKKQMRDGLYSLYQNIMQLEDNYKMVAQGLRVAEEDFQLKKLQYEVGMLSKQDYLAAELALCKAENNFNQIIYQHEALKQTFYKPWAAQMETASKDV